MESARVTPAALRAAIVYNPTKLDLFDLRSAVAEAERTARWASSLWLSTTEDDPGSETTRDALRQNVAMVVAAGGDGTVRAVAETLMNTGVPLAIVPAGTGNLLARNLSLAPVRLAKSVAAAFNSHARAIDVGVAKLTYETGETSERVFVVMAGIGLDAHMIANTKPSLKNRVGWLAYLDSGMKSIWSHTPITVCFSLDGAPEQTARVSTILIGNCGTMPGNIKVLPDSAIDDGVLDIAVVQPDGVVGWIQVGHRVAWKNGFLRRRAMRYDSIKRSKPATLRALNYMRGTRLRVEVDPPEQIQLDGDDYGRVRSVSIEVNPRSLLVKVPAGPRQK